MNLIEQLSEKETDLISYIIENCGDPIDEDISCFDKSKLPYILRFWNDYKKDLFQLFGEKLILEKEIEITMNQEEAEEQFYHMRQKSSFIREYFHWLYTIDDQPIRATLRKLVYQYLYKNIYEGHTINLDKITIRYGEKAMRVLSKLNDLYIHSDDFENFRLEHSKVLNQKTIKGTLCLSIHPLDFMTMSDNTYEWDSCVSWITDCGSCRHGVIEMMNSPYVVVAYIKGEKPFMEWTNKKWRSLFIVSKQLISAVRAYPYENEEITKIILNWLRELAEITKFSSYFKKIFEVTSGVSVKTSCLTETKFFINTNYMYNDYYGPHLSYISIGADKWESINYSGPLNCMICGETYTPKNGIFIGCSNCYPYFYCEGCDQWLPCSRQATNTNPDLCLDCVENEI